MSKSRIDERHLRKESELQRRAEVLRTGVLRVQAIMDMTDKVPRNFRTWTSDDAPEQRVHAVLLAWMGTLRFFISVQKASANLRSLLRKGGRVPYWWQIKRRRQAQEALDTLLNLLSSKEASKRLLTEEDLPREDRDS